jgi:hypothetical protein
MSGLSSATYYSNLHTSNHSGFLPTAGKISVSLVLNLMVSIGARGAVVLGMHRSGTSLVAEMLHRCGTAGRAEECLPADQWNARGYWELSSLVRFNERLLSDIGATWTLPPRPQDDQRLESLAQRPDYRAEAIHLLGRMNTSAASGPWFWKDPRLSLLLPFWQKVWRDIRYVICVRDPYEICLSLHERDGLSFDISIALWQRYMLAVLKWTQGLPRIFLNYSKILQQPGQESSRLAQFLHPAADEIPRRTPVREMQKAVDPQLRHCTTDRIRLARAMTDAQKELFDVLLNLSNPSHAPQPLDFDRYALPKMWRLALKRDLLVLRAQKYWNRWFTAPAQPITAEKYCEAWTRYPSGTSTSGYDLP